jgi:hypothetical protein
MIEDILKPKSDKEIIKAISDNPCEVERFTLGFCYYFEKDPRIETIPELISTLQNPLLKITINVNREDIGPDLSPVGFKTFRPPVLEHEIIVEQSDLHFGAGEYNRKMIIIKHGQCYIMP